MQQAVPQAAATGGAGSTLTVLLLLAGLLVIVAIGVKLYDLKRKRDAEAVHLQAQVSDALLRDQSLFGLAVTPTATPSFSIKSSACMGDEHALLEQSVTAAMRSFALVNFNFTMELTS